MSHQASGSQNLASTHFFGFDAETYWATRPIKKWVVVLKKTSKKKQESDVKLVAAKTREGAIKTAQFHSFLENPNQISCRLAIPQDFM